MGEASPYLGNWTVKDGSQAVTELTKKPPSASVWGPPTSPAQHMQAETLTRSATCRKVASLPITPSCSPHLPPNSTGSSVFAKRFLSRTDGEKKKPCNFVLQTPYAVEITTFCSGLPAAGTHASRCSTSTKQVAALQAPSIRLRDCGVGTVVYEETRHQTHTQCPPDAILKRVFVASTTLLPLYWCLKL